MKSRRLLRTALAAAVALAPLGCGIGDSPEQDWQLLQVAAMEASREQRYEEAVTLYERALAALEQAGAPHERARLLRGLSSVQIELRDLRGAEQSLLQELRLYDSPNDTAAQAVLVRLGRLYEDMDDWARAEAMFEHALEVRKTSGAGTRELAQGLANLAGHHRRRGELGEAQAFYQQALEALEQETAVRPRADILLALAEVKWDQGHRQDAEELVLQEIRLVESVLPLDVPALWIGLRAHAGILEGMGRGNEARAVKARADRLAEENVIPRELDLNE